MAKDQARADLSDLARQTRALFELSGAAVPQQAGKIMKVQKDMQAISDWQSHHVFGSADRSGAAPPPPVPDANTPRRPDRDRIRPVGATWRIADVAPGPVGNTPRS